MFGANAFGWAYFGQDYAGTTNVAWTLSLSDTITLSDATAKTVTLAKSDTTTLSEAIVKSITLAKADTLVSVLENITTPASSTVLVDASTSDAESFAAPVAANQVAVEVYVLNDGLSATADLTVSVYSDSAGLPGSSLGSTTIPRASIGDDYDWASATVPVSVVAGTTYWLVLSYGGVGGGFQWGASSSDSFAGGAAASTLSGSWALLAGNDFNFKVTLGGLQDAISKSPGLVKSDTVTLTDTAAKTARLTKSDTLTLSDAAVKAVAKAASDSLTLTDATAKVITKAQADALTLTDAIANSVGVTLDDTLTVEDATAMLVVFLLSLDDTITLDDLATVESTSTPTEIFGVMAATRTVFPSVHYALSLDDTITIGDRVSLHHDDSVTRMFDDLEQLLALDLIPA